MAASDFGKGGGAELRWKQTTCKREGGEGDTSIVHVLRSGSGRLGRGVRGQPRVGTRPVPLRRVGARPLHVGAHGPHRARACRPGTQTAPSGWGSRSANAAELARGLLPMTESRRRWAALRSTLQFVDLLQRDTPEPKPPHLLTIGVVQLVRAHGYTCPREEPNLFVFLVLSIQRCSGPTSRVLTRFPPLERMRRILLATTVRCSPHSESDDRISCSR